MAPHFSLFLSISLHRILSELEIYSMGEILTAGCFTKHGRTLKDHGGTYSFTLSR